jgi:hypothetical protein
MKRIVNLNNVKCADNSYPNKRSLHPLKKGKLKQHMLHTQVNLEFTKVELESQVAGASKCMGTKKSEVGIIL